MSTHHRLIHHVHDPHNRQELELLIGVGDVVAPQTETVLPDDGGNIVFVHDVRLGVLVAKEEPDGARSADDALNNPV